MANAPSVATYTNDPENRTLDRVRFEVGDTDCSTAWLSDAEIRACIAVDSSPLRAASRAASAIAAKVARRTDFSHGPVRKSLSQLFTHYLDLADDLMRRANVASTSPAVLGVEIAEKEEANQDDSRVQPSFRRGMHDNPRAGDVPLSDPEEWRDEY